MVYSATIEGVSPKGTLIQFTHEGTVRTLNPGITIQPLTPQSSYIFKVSAITSRGQGREITVEADTSNVDSEFGIKLVMVIQLHYNKLMYL